MTGLGLANVDSSQKLAALLDRNVARLAGDANELGSARQAVDPLLALLPAGALLTRAGIEKLGLDELGETYLVLEQWARSHPQLRDAGCNGRPFSEDFARVLASCSRKDPLWPAWLAETGMATLPVSERVTVDGWEVWGYKSSGLDLAALRITAVNCGHVTTFQHGGYINFDIKGNGFEHIELMFLNHRLPRWHLAASNGNKALDQLPTTFLELCRGEVAARPRDYMNKEVVASFLQEAEAVCASRRAFDEVVAALVERWRAGEVSEGVSALDPASLNALAAGISMPPRP
jgi:hypothetical protein